MHMSSLGNGENDRVLTINVLTEEEVVVSGPATQFTLGDIAHRFFSAMRP